MENRKKFELFEDLFQTSLKIHNQLTEEDKIYYFHSRMRGDALQKTSPAPTERVWGEILTVFRGKYVKPQSMATAKHKFHQLVLNPAEPEVNWFFGRTPESGKRCVRSWCPSNHWAIHTCQDASTPEKINKPGHLENGTYEQIVTHLERELELNGLEYPDETQMNTVTNKQEIAGNPDKCRNNSSDTNDCNPNNHKNDRKYRTLYPLCETCGKTNHSTDRCYVGANAANRHFLKNKPQEQTHTTA